MKNNSGFTLVELSIVLVIIGLIVSGVLVGTELVRVAKLQNFIGNLQEYENAYFTYEAKFNAIPGDHNKASIFLDGCVDEPGSPCNGNGDRKVDLVSVSIETEDSRFWNHLSLAGLISGDYPGLNPSTDSATTGLGNESFFWVYYTGGSTGDIVGNAMVFSTPPTGAGMATEDLFFIDEKLDDGIPTSGAMREGGVIPNPPSPAPVCSVSDEYNLAETRPYCGIEYWF